MRLFRNLPLRHKLTLLSLITTAVAMALTCAGFVAHELVTFRKELVADAATAAEMIGYNSASALSFNDAKSAEETLGALSAQPEIRAACIYDKDGHVFATYPPGQSAAAFGLRVPGALERLGSDRLELFRPIRQGGEEIGSIYLRSDFREMWDRLRRLAAIVGGVIAVAILVAYFLASRLQRMISGPVSDLASIVGRVAAQKDFAIRAVKHGEDELGRLIDGFNEMLGQIQLRDGALQSAHDSLERRVAERTGELQQAQAEAAREKDRLQLIFESVPVGICLDHFSPAGRRDRLLNSAHLTICGLTREQAVEGAFQRLTHPDDVAPQAALRQQLDAGAIDRFSLEKRYLRPDGRIAWVVFTVQRRRYPDGGRQDLSTLVDITDLKHAQTVAMQEQARLKFIFDSVPMGISLVVNDAGNTHLVNRAHERITGVSARDSTLPGVFMRASHPDDYRRQMELVQPFIRGEVDHYSVEKRYLHDDGSIVWAVLTSRKITDQVTGVVQSITTLVDITERKLAEGKLAEASGLLEAMLDNSPDFIYFKDRESRFVRFSRAVLKNFNSDDPALLLGRTDADVFTPEHALPTYQDEQEIIRTGEPIVGKLERESHRDGRVTWVLTTKMPWRNGAGEIIGIFGISKDVTPLKQAEDKLAYERDQLRALLDSSPDMIYFKDAQSRFALVSRSKVQNALARVPDLRERRTAHGLPADVPEAELLTGLTDFDTFSDDDARLAYADEQRIGRTGETIIGKAEKQAFLDGTVRWSLTSKMPWHDHRGQIIGTFGISKDITDLKETEEKLELTHRELLQTSRQAGMAEVATGVLHNVGNVLNSVNVSATLVADHVRQTKAGNVAKLAALFAQHKTDLGDFLTQDARGRMIPGYLGTLAESLAEENKAIITELEHLRKNVEHIKDIVAMQQSYARTSGVFETISVPDMIEDALRINAGSLARHDVQTVRDYQARPVVTTDKHKVMQILINLIRNAKYACDEAGRTDKKIIVRTTADERGVKIAIIDNGVGIPAENLVRIFNHGFTTRKTGHGFGLHSGALAAKELGGALNVESAGPGHGAAFVLELPFKSPAANA